MKVEVAPDDANVRWPDAAHHSSGRFAGEVVPDDGNVRC